MQKFASVSDTSSNDEISLIESSQNEVTEQDQSYQSRESSTEGESGKHLKLSWMIRDKVLQNLNRHTALLNNRTTSGQSIKDNVFSENNNLILLLFNLPRQTVDEEQLSAKLAEQQATSRPKKVKLNHERHPVLQLTYTLRERIIANLTRNHHFVVLYSDATSKEKEQLISENNQLAQILLNLPVSVDNSGIYVDSIRSSNGVHLIQPDDKWNKSSNDVVKVADEKKNDEECLLKYNNDQPKNGMQLEMNDQAFRLTMELNEMKRELLQKMAHLDTMRSEAEFTFKVTNLTDLTELNNKTYFSQSFFVQGIAWAIGITTITDCGVKYLSCYLHRRDRLDFVSCLVEAQLHLLSNNPSQDKVLRLTNNFTRMGGFGNPKFISWSELMKTENGYYVNDSFTLGVKMTVQDPISNAQLLFSKN